ncbi:hypothetical protein KAU39_04760 [bacterium]|nr:hypothetical protein [bacterium]
MNRIRYVFLIFFFVFSFLIFNHSLIQAKWKIEILDTEDDVGQYTSIAIDKDNYPHISYYDVTSSDLKYVYWDNSSWIHNIVDSIGDVGKYSSLALNTANCPHISYFNNTNLHLKYAKKVNSIWYIEEPEGASGGPDSSIALDTNGNPHISFLYLGPPRLGYAYLYPSYPFSWYTNYSIEVNNTGYYTSIALNSQTDEVYISYYDLDNGDLKYARKEGLNWYKEIIDSDYDVGLYTSLALDSDNYPYISYYDNTHGDLKYAYLNGSSWSICIIDSQDNVGQYTSLQIDSNDNPHISYYDASNGRLKYAYKNGSSPWAIEIVDEEGYVGQYSSLALDENDHPHISYYDVTNADLKYAKWVPGYFIKGHVKNSAGVGLECINLTLSGDDSRTSTTTDIGYYEFLDLLSGNYTLTATKSDGTISFEQKNYLPLENNLENQDFIGVEIEGIKRKMEVHNYPNPCRRGKGTTFVYTVDKENNVLLNIYTDVGEFVRGVIDVHSLPGTYEAEWNGKDIHGNRMEAGLYFVVLKVGNEVTKNALVILP